MIKHNAQELRTSPVNEEEQKQIKRNPITIICDNVLDTYNVGSIFRLADAIAAEKVILCGATETPPNSRIKKASINTWQWTPWEHAETAKEAVQKCQMPRLHPAKAGSTGGQVNAKCQIVAVEQDARSVPFYQAEYQFPLAIVVGNETYGVSKDVLDVADIIVELPMWGINKSLNVMVSCGIILYEVMKQKKS